MKLIYQGKTKDVYALDNGNIRLIFKDTMTGKDGVFDPGENTVGLEVEGSGRAGLALSQYFFEKMADKGIPTHYISADLDQASMDVRKVEVFGQGIEVICRYKAVGSFIRRYGVYIESGQDLPAFVEMSIKDDVRQDPMISKDALAILGIMSEADYEEVKNLTLAAADLVKEELAQKGLSLYDIKFEFAKDVETGQILLIDEVSGGNMRVYDGDNKSVDPLDLIRYFE